MGRKAVYFSAGLAGGRLLAGLMLLGLLLMVPGPSRRARRPLSRGGAGSAAGRLLRLGLFVAELRPLRRQQGAAAAAKSQTLEERFRSAEDTSELQPLMRISYGVLGFT